MRGEETTVLKSWPGAAGKILVTVLSICWLFLLISRTSSQSSTASEQISAETNRLKQTLPSLKLPDDETKQYADGLKRVETTLQSGYVFLSLYYLYPLRVTVSTYQYQQSKAEVAKQGNEAFEAEWRSLGQQLATKEKLLVPEPSQLPAAARALAEIALSQVHPYYQSGRLYGQNTTLENGLFYLGRVPGCLEFALFSQQLHFTPPRSGLKARSFEPELAALEAETLAAYKQTADKDLRPFINVNIAMKMATDLNHEKRYFGALLKYLDASLALKLLTASPPTPDEQTALKKQHAAFGQQLSSGKTDQSIGLIYWEMAQRALEPQAEVVISPEDLKRAAVVITEVMPRYFKATSKVVPKS